MMTLTTIGDDGNPNNDGFAILGSCNGLTLVTIGMRDLFMWNPTTRQAKKIVPPESHCFTDGFKNIRHISFLYGLGYVESTYEYKIVCIFFSYMKHRPTTTEIYSSRTGSWKKIENIDEGFTFNGNKKFINGKLHWLIKYDNGGKWDIVALDLSEEKYEIVGRPQNFPDRTHHPTQLHALGGYLSFTSYYEVNSRVTDVWVMTKYGETGSWIRAWTLYSEMARGITCMLWLRLTTAENRDSIILVSYGPDAVVYNGLGVLHKSRVDKVDSSTPKYNVEIDANNYVESLVSPFF
ncbi:hypothetical protein ACP275_14G052100 [Erythranthe tilingii]